MVTKDWLRTQILLGKDISPQFRELFLKKIDALSPHQNALTLSLAKAQTLYAELPSLPEISLPEIEDILTAAKLELEALRTAVDDRREAFEAFRQIHGRIALPQTPSSFEAVLSCGAMVVVEAAVNASFFLTAHMSSGAFAAMITSTLISATNVCVSACAGFYAGRWMQWGATAQHRDDPEFKWARRKARFFKYLYLAAIGAFHLTVGLIRSQEELHSISHSFEAYLELLTTPESYFLVLVGACMSGLSYSKGMHGFSDPYPEYSSKHDAIEEARDAYADGTAFYTEEINSRFDDAVDRVSRAFKSLSAQTTAYNKVVAECVKADGTLRNAVLKSEANLRAELADFKSQQQSSTRRKKGKSDFSDLENLCDLSAHLSHQLPKYVSASDPSPFLSQIETARQRALAHLAALSTIAQITEE